MTIMVFVKKTETLDKSKQLFNDLEEQIENRRLIVA